MNSRKSNFHSCHQTIINFAVINLSGHEADLVGLLMQDPTHQCGLGSFPRLVYVAAVKGYNMIDSLP